MCVASNSYRHDMNDTFYYIGLVIVNKDYLEHSHSQEQTWTTKTKLGGKTGSVNFSNADLPHLETSASGSLPASRSNATAGPCVRRSTLVLSLSFLPLLTSPRDMSFTTLRFPD